MSMPYMLKQLPGPTGLIWFRYELRDGVPGFSAPAMPNEVSAWLHIQELEAKLQHATGDEQRSVVENYESTIAAQNDRAVEQELIIEALRAEVAGLRAKKPKAEKVAT